MRERGLESQIATSGVPRLAHCVARARPSRVTRDPRGAGLGAEDGTAGAVAGALRAQVGAQPQTSPRSAGSAHAGGA